MNIRPDPHPTWKAEFCTGVSIIDDQHRVLFNMLNGASQKLNERSSQAELERFVRGVLNYACYHFDTEERYAATSGYDVERSDEAAAHQAQHRDFVAKIAATKASISCGQTIESTDLIAFLNEWLTTHVLQSDRKLGLFVSGRRADATMQAAG